MTARAVGRLPSYYHGRDCFFKPPELGLGVAVVCDVARIVDANCTRIYKPIRLGVSVQGE